MSKKIKDYFYAISSNLGQLSLEEEVPEGYKTYQNKTEEENTNGVKEREDEVVFYCRIGDMDALSQAVSKESHEQWEIKTNHGRVRVRKTTKPDLEPTYELTFKKKDNAAGISGGTEQNFDIDEVMFESFKSLAEGGMIKDRYNFSVNSITIETSEGLKDIEVPDMLYEVDAFKKIEGGYHEWCKVDLEVHPLIAEIEKNHPEIKDFSLVVKTINLPFKPLDTVLDYGNDQTVKTQIRKLYDDYFLTKK